MSAEATPLARWEDIAESAYKAYSAVTDNKNFRGEEVPKFQDLPDKIQDAWNAAVRQAAQCLDGVTIDGQGASHFPDEAHWKGFKRP